jgi:DNA-binding NarL/FixJ family response regulator
MAECSTSTSRSVWSSDRPASRGPRKSRCCPARELEVLRLVAAGSTHSETTRTLWVTEQTVKFHLSSIYRKLEVDNGTEANHGPGRV